MLTFLGLDLLCIFNGGVRKRGKSVGLALPSYTYRSKDLERTVNSHLHTLPIPGGPRSPRPFYIVHDLVLSAVSDANYNIPVLFVRI